MAMDRVEIQSVRYRELLQQLGALGAARQQAVYLVGGPVRDLLRGVVATDVDVAVAGATEPLARELTARGGGRVTWHERFGTASVILATGERVDLTPLRQERYPYPGALPVVEPAELMADLQRRDFTFNAMALRLDRDFGSLHDPLGGRTDLQARLLRALHPATFRDDPTRILRAARYAARLAGQLEPVSERWLLAAVKGGALQTVSGPRLWGELERLLAEPQHGVALEWLQQWGVLAEMGLRWPEGGAEALAAVVAAGDEANLNPGAAAERPWATVALLAGTGAADLTAEWGLRANQRKTVIEAAQLIAAPPPAVFAEAIKSSTLQQSLGDLTLATQILLWARYPAARSNLQRLASWREWQLEVTGKDLQAAGYAPGPQFSQALQAAWQARLDEGAGRERQLQRALETLHELGVQPLDSD
jgi:tRNA nucleotidyltransferase (CCA-adding enzyme)